jgi:hypothetical protein
MPKAGDGAEVGPVVNLPEAVGSCNHYFSSDTAGGLVDRGLAKVIPVPNRIGAHRSKLSIADCTVTLIELIDAPLEGFSNFG